MSLGYPNEHGGRTSKQGLFYAFGQIFEGDVVGGFKVSQNSPVGMSVVIGGAQGVLDSALIKDSTGATYPLYNPDRTQITAAVEASNSTNPRIDLVVLYIDSAAAATKAVYDNSNKAKAAVVSGIAATTPADPTVSRIQSVIGANSPYIVLARINVSAGVTTITNSVISDTRNLISKVPQSYARPELHATIIDYGTVIQAGDNRIINFSTSVRLNNITKNADNSYKVQKSGWYNISYQVTCADVPQSYKAEIVAAGKRYAQSSQPTTMNGGGTNRQAVCGAATIYLSSGDNFYVNFSVAGVTRISSTALGETFISAVMVG